MSMVILKLILVLFVAYSEICSMDIKQVKTTDWKLFLASGIQKEKLQSHKMLEIPSIGRSAQLGEVYDVRTDRFLNISVIRDVKVFSNSKTNGSKFVGDREFLHSDSIIEKFNFMSINPESQIGILADLVRPEGAGRFLLDKKSFNHNVQVTMGSRMKTINEIIAPMDFDIRNHIDFELLGKVNATHIVYEVHWGGYAFATIQDFNYENADQTILGQRLERAMQYLYQIYSSEGTQLHFNDTFLKSIENLKFNLYSDLLPEDSFYLPQNLMDGMKFMANLTKLVKATNEAKGKPRTFIAMEINDFKYLYGTEERILTTRNELNKFIVKDLVEAFDRCQQLVLSFNTMRSEVQYWKDYSHLKIEGFGEGYLEEYLNEFFEKETSFQNSFKVLKENVLNKLKTAKLLGEDNEIEEASKMINEFVSWWREKLRTNLYRIALLKAS